jgi:hypothetical protein
MAVSFFANEVVWLSFCLGWHDAIIDKAIAIENLILVFILCRFVALQISATNIMPLQCEYDNSRAKCGNYS